MTATAWPHGGLRCRCGHQAPDRPALFEHLATAGTDARWNPELRRPHGVELHRQLWLAAACISGAVLGCTLLAAAGVPGAGLVGWLAFMVVWLGVPPLAGLHLKRAAQRYRHGRARRALLLSRFDAEADAPGYRVYL